MKKRFYTAPLSEIVAISIEDFLCYSTMDIILHDIGFDDEEIGGPDIPL